jgi:hypothetical protein
MFGASSPCWRVEQGSSSNVVTTGNNFVLSGPLQYLFFLIQSVTNPFYHFFRISFNNVISIGESVSLNFCTKSPTTGKLTEYDTQILCYGGDTSTGASTIGTNGQGTMILNAKRIGINKINPTSELDVNGVINCTALTASTLNTSNLDVSFKKITVENGIFSKNTYYTGSSNAPYFKITDKFTHLYDYVRITYSINPSIYTEIGGLGVNCQDVSCQNLLASGNVVVDNITFLNATENSEQIIRGSQGSTYFRKWNGTAYDGLSHIHANSLKLTGNYGFTTAGNVFANNIYPSTGDVHTDALPALPTTTIPSSNQNYIINGNFSTPLIPSNGGSLLVSDMTSSQLKSLYPWICYNGKSNVMIHNAETYSFPPFTGALQGITQNIEIQNDASIYQIVNVPSDNTYRLQMYYAYSELGYDINNLSIYVDSIWRSNLMTEIPEVTPPNAWTLFSFDIMLTEGNHVITISGQSDYYTSEWLTIGTGITNVTLNQITSIGGTPVMTSSSIVPNPRNQWTSDGDIVVKSLAIQKSSYGISAKGELTVNTITISNATNKCDLNLGAGTLTCGSLKQTSIADGNFTITEETGSTASHSTGSLIIKHKNAGGSSSIVFPASKANGDYGYIQFNEGAGTGDTGNPLERSASLIIGCENDVGSVGDYVIIRPNSSNTGCVGINTPSTSRPTCALDINGTCQASIFKIRDSVTTPLTNRDTFTVDTNGAITATSLSFLGEYKLDGVRLQFGTGANPTSHISCNDWDTSLMNVGGIIRFNHNNIPYVNQNQNYYIKQIINNYQITITGTPPPNSATGTAITFVLLNIALGYVTVQYNGDNMTGSKIALPSCAIGEQNATSTKLQTLQVNNTSSITGSVFTIQNHTNTTSGSTYGPLTTTKVLDISNTGDMTLNGNITSNGASSTISCGTGVNNTLTCGKLNVGGTTNGISNTGVFTARSLNVGGTTDVISNTGIINANYVKSASAYNLSYTSALPTYNDTDIGYQYSSTFNWRSAGLDGAVTTTNSLPFLFASSGTVKIGIYMCHANAYFVTSDGAAWQALIGINTANNAFNNYQTHLFANVGTYPNKYLSTSSVIKITAASQIICGLLGFNYALTPTTAWSIRIVCTRIA